MYYFGDLIENECKKERYKLKMKSVSMPEGLIDKVMDWEDEYREDFIKRLYNGECWKLVFSNEINSIYLDLFIKKDSEIKKLSDELNKYITENVHLGAKIRNFEFKERATIPSHVKDGEIKRLEDKVSMLECNIKKLKQEVNDRTWGKNKPYKL